MSEPVASTTMIERVGDAYVVTLRGEIDAYTSPALRHDLRRLIEDVGVSTLVIDLSAVTFLDSSALGALVGALRRLRERDGGLRIVEPSTTAARIFSLTGLDAVFDLYPTCGAALSGASG